MARRLTFLVISVLALILIVALPSAAGETEVWKEETSGWVSEYAGGNPVLTANARAWTSGGTLGTCNKKDWPIVVTNQASIAQWINWSLSATQWDWRVRKPGTYATDCITFWIQSNQAVAIDYDGFADLHSSASVNPDIETYYGFSGTGQGTPQGVAWVRAAALNSDDDLLPDSGDLHDGISYKLWNKIVVVNCNSACQYNDTATITLTLQVIKDWIDPSSGNFKP